jgi:hypothetical protein
MHPNEIPLVFRAASGALLPTRQFNALIKQPLTRPQRHALREQLIRQEADLTAAAALDVLPVATPAAARPTA